MVPLKLSAVLTAFCVVLFALTLGFLLPSTKTVTRIKTRTVYAKHATIYVVNKSPRYISDRTILRDIPAWEKAANGSFSKSWLTPQVRIRLVKRVPRGGIEALFVDRGSVHGALAYHTVEGGVPKIVVYAGTGAYYGFNNSVSFTHELFEMLADPTLANLNFGYPEPIVWIGSQATFIPGNVAWVSEVCDPVEAYAYHIGRTAISDWITPNWFNDGQAGGEDYMGVATQPLQILSGGYAQFFDGLYHAIVNFRGAGPDADGFLKGEKIAGRGA